MKTKSKPEANTKELELKNRLLLKFTQILKGLGFGNQLFEKKLEKSTEKLAKSILKKKGKEEKTTKVSKKTILIEPAKLKRTTTKPSVNKKPAIKAVSSSKSTQPTVEKKVESQTKKETVSKTKRNS